MNGTRVLVLLPLLVGLAHCFSWDLVMGEGNQLKFYHNGTLTHTEYISSSMEILTVIYDPVDVRVLFAAFHDRRPFIFSYDLTTGKIETLIMKITSAADYVKLAYDPLNQLLFWSGDTKIYSMSLKHASTDPSVVGNLILKLNKHCSALVVDSCGGYIYWATDDQIARAALDGSNREVLVDSSVYKRPSLVIDQQTQTMFWTDQMTYRYEYSIESADLNGKNRRTFYPIGSEFGAAALTVSKDNIYWRSVYERAILRLPKHKEYGVAPTVYTGCSIDSWSGPFTATNYTIEEQTLGVKNCEALKSLTHRSTAKNLSTCLNYCLHGNCSISAEGLPNCSCEAGYTGERCEVNVCYKHCLHGGVCSLSKEMEPVCQCTAGYEGERCDVATSNNGVQAENTQQEIGQDLRGDVTQVNIEELKRALLFFSDKVDEYEANIEIQESQ